MIPPNRIIVDTATRTCRQPGGELVINWLAERPQRLRYRAYVAGKELLRQCRLLHAARR